MPVADSERHNLPSGAVVERAARLGPGILTPEGNSDIPIGESYCAEIRLLPVRNAGCRLISMHRVRAVADPVKISVEGDFSAHGLLGGEFGMGVDVPGIEPDLALRPGGVGRIAECGHPAWFSHDHVAAPVVGVEVGRVAWMLARRAVVPAGSVHGLDAPSGRKRGRRGGHLYEVGGVPAEAPIGFENKCVLKKVPVGLDGRDRVGDYGAVHVYLGMKILGIVVARSS